MRQVLMLLLVGVLVGVWVARDRAGDEARLDGEWRAVEGVIDGESVAESVLGQLRRRFCGGRFVARQGDRVVARGRVRLDGRSAPGRIDVWVDGCGSAPRLGLFRLEGGRLLTCVARPGADRPDDFTAPPGSGRTLVVWQRTG